MLSAGERRLRFSADGYRRRLPMTGLALDIWTGLASASSHELFYTNCLSTISGVAPSVRTDMSLFPNGIHSGETTGNAETDPFTQVLGGSKDRFCALFGEYSFSIRADDSGAVWMDDGLVVRCAYGNSGTEARGSVMLTRGWHPIKVMFGEETGWEVFIVKVKRPGDSAYIDLGSNNFMRNPDASPDDPEGFDYKTVYGDLFAKKKAAEGDTAAEEPEDDETAQVTELQEELTATQQNLVKDLVSHL